MRGPPDAAPGTKAASGAPGRAMATGLPALPAGRKAPGK